jgi:putative peptide zinc metalloprotease protein
VDPDSRVVMHDLTFRHEDGEVLVGRPETGVFVAIPEIGAEILTMLGNGMPIGMVGDQLKLAHGADVDLDEFLDELLAVGFVKAVDGHDTADDGVQQPAGREWNWLAPAAAVIFSWPANALWLAIVAAAPVILIIRPSVLPRPGELYWTSSSSVVVVSTTAFAVVAVLSHEAAHLAAARSYGITARLSLSTRLGDLVMQTRATGLWNVPRRQRYRFYLAGMKWDLFLLGAVILARASLAPAASVSRFLGAASALLVLQLAWQAGLYTRTDLYLVVMDMMRCRNLFGDTVAYLRFRAGTAVRLIRGRPRTARTNPLDAIPRREHAWIKVYAFLMVPGSIAAVGLAVLFGVPFIVHLIRSTGHEIISGSVHGRWAMAADGAITIIFEGSFMALFIVTFIREKTRPRDR